MIYTPSSELVAVAWLRSISLPLVSDISTTVPAVNTWKQPTWVQVTALAGRADAYDPVRVPYIQVDIWGLPKKFGETNSVAELIYDATFESLSHAGTLPVRSGFYPVHLAEVQTFTPPRVFRDDPGKLARTSMMCSLVYQIVRS